MPELRREDVPRELHPLFDALSAEISRVQVEWRRLQTARRWLAFGAGGMLFTALVNVAVAVWGT